MGLLMLFRRLPAVIDKKGEPQCGPCHWVEKVHNAPYDSAFLILLR